MVGEVNKIIYNLLMSGGEVCIGDIGTLLTMRYAAHRTSRKSLTPGYRSVVFTTEQRGTSLEKEIARVAEVDEAKAHDIYEHWLSEALDGDTLTIEGVGSLRHDKFNADEAFIATLNPQGRTPIRLKPKANVGLYIFAALCMVFALSVAGYVYIDNNDITLFGASDDTTAEIMAQNVTSEAVSKSAETEASSAEIAPQTQAQEQPQAEAQPNVEPQVQIQEPKQEHPAEAANVATDAGAILSTTPGHSYVVLGVFSTTENAGRAIRQAQRRAKDLQYSVYHYGSKYMVALYEAQSRRECQEFASSLDNTFKDLWIYSRK
ncbi:MAG: hypothetical protein E7130_07290 [Rikenellaceae bacterium]|nr:hypothetical protein [Rikenellaceae bacterium]